MSTSLYLKCISHDQPITSSDLGTKRTEKLKEIRDIVAERDKWVDAFNFSKDYISLDSFNQTTWAISFLVEHPKCEIELRDGYGYLYSLTDDSYEPIDENHILYEAPKKPIHAAAFVDGIAVPRCLMTFKLQRDNSHEIDCPECIEEMKKLGLRT